MRQKLELESTRKANPDKYKYNRYGIGFDSHLEFPFTDRSIGKNVITFRAEIAHLSLLIIREKIC